MKKILTYIFIMCTFILLITGCSKEKNKDINPLEFKSDKLGFSLTFPESWSGKYEIEENDMGINVYFKPQEKVKSEFRVGSLFSIVNKKSEKLYEEMFDTVGDRRYFEVNGETYVIGGPTDVNFPGDHSEFETFLKMSKECGEVLKSLK